MYHVAMVECPTNCVDDKQYRILRDQKYKLPTGAMPQALHPAAYRTFDKLFDAARDEKARIPTETTLSTDAKWEQLGQNATDQQTLAMCATSLLHIRWEFGLNHYKFRSHPPVSVVSAELKLKELATREPYKSVMEKHDPFSNAGIAHGDILRSHDENNEQLDCSFSIGSMFKRLREESKGKAGRVFVTFAGSGDYQNIADFPKEPCRMYELITKIHFKFLLKYSCQMEDTPTGQLIPTYESLEDCLNVVLEPLKECWITICKPDADKIRELRENYGVAHSENDTGHILDDVELQIEVFVHIRSPLSTSYGTQGYLRATAKTC
jgi:hypothetical protein